MKIRYKSLNHIKKDIKMYNDMGYKYIGNGLGYFKNSRSLTNNNYAGDRYINFMKKYSHKSRRRQSKINITNENL